MSQKNKILAGGLKRTLNERSGDSELPLKKRVYQQESRTAANTSSHSDVADGGTDDVSDSESESSDSSDNTGTYGGFTFADSGVKPNQVETSAADSGIAAKLMAKMGYKTGTGLGKHSQGRVAPVEASTQKGRRGLGMAPSAFEIDSRLEWKPEEVVIKEPIEWIPSADDTNNILPFDDLKEWLRIGPIKKSIDDETEFVHPQVLKNILNCKTIFDELEDRELRKARTRSNPFELIRGVMFQNRAAMKMANMDAAFDFMFSNPKDSNGQSLVGATEPLYFADICAGPGGFSEYLLWRRKWRCKGFGLTLKYGEGVNDFKLDEFYVSPSECFEPHYGVGGADGDGDIYRQDNLYEFAKFVRENTNGQGLHFVMGDGGFSVEGQENVQEILSKRLYLCQFLCAISILREGGHFLCKLFDVFTPFSAGLIYLIRMAFEQVTIMKPVTSRPANSERYIVCKGFLAQQGHILHQYLSYVNGTFDQVKFGTSSQRQCIQQIVPMDILKGDENFYTYLYNSNTDLGQQQCLHLQKIRIFTKNPNLIEPRQTEVRSECLELWKIPDELRVAPERETPLAAFQRLVGHQTHAYGEDLTPVDTKSLAREVRSVYDYKCYVSGLYSTKQENKLCYILSLGHSLVYKWDGQPSSKWVKVVDDETCKLSLDIPRDTLLQAEIVQELRGEGKGQRRLMSLHITDVAFLYNEDFRHHSYNRRLEAAQVFVSAINKPTRKGLAPVHAKRLYKVEELSVMMDNNLSFRVLKGSGAEPRLCYCDNPAAPQPSCHVVVGIHLVPYIKKPWTMTFSRSSNRKYFYNLDTKLSSFEPNKDAFATFDYACQHRLVLSQGLQSKAGFEDMQTELKMWIQSIAPWTA